MDHLTPPNRALDPQSRVSAGPYRAECELTEPFRYSIRIDLSVRLRARPHPRDCSSPQNERWEKEDAPADDGSTFVLYGRRSPFDLLGSNAAWAS